MMNLVCNCSDDNCSEWVHISEKEYWEIREKYGSDCHFENNSCEVDPDTVMLEIHNAYRVVRFAMEE